MLFSTQVARHSCKQTWKTNYYYSSLCCKLIGQECIGAGTQSSTVRLWLCSIRTQPTLIRTTKPCVMVCPTITLGKHYKNAALFSTEACVKIATGAAHRVIHDQYKMSKLRCLPLNLGKGVLGRVFVSGADFSEGWRGLRFSKLRMSPCRSAHDGT